MKKIISVYLSLIFAFSFLTLTASASVDEYGIYLGNIQITAENAGDIFSDGGSAKYEKGVLFLSDAAINGTLDITKGDKIVLNGVNTVDLRNSNDDIKYGIKFNELAISGNGTLKVYTGDGYYLYGAGAGTVISISDSVKLEIHTGKAKGRNFGIYADTISCLSENASFDIYVGENEINDIPDIHCSSAVCGKIILNGGKHHFETATLTNNTDSRVGQNYAVYCTGAMYLLKGAEIEAYAGTVAGKNTESVGIFYENTYVRLESAVIKAKGFTTALPLDAIKGYIDEANEDVLVADEYNGKLRILKENESTQKYYQNILICPKETPVPEEPGFFAKIGEFFKNLWNSIVEFFSGLFN